MMQRVLKCSSFILLFALLTALSVAAQVEEPPTYIGIIMDASGSMQALIESGRSRIAVARDEIIALSSELTEDVNVSLWVYGHRLSQADPAASCLDIEKIIPMGAPDPALFASTVNSVEAIGYTPLATSLGMAYSGLPPDGRAIIVLMSDGEESCGGDPCAVAAELDARNIELRIHTIGFSADAGTRAQLQCISEVTGGNYYEAQDTEGLRQALRAATTPITGEIAVVRSDGEIATGVSFSVVNSLGEPSGTVVGSGSFEPGDYIVTVNTEPPIEASVSVIAGETTTITLPELGNVRVVNAEGEVLEQFALTAYTPGSSSIFGSGVDGVMQLPPGTYDVQVGNTEQRETVTVAAGETVDIQVDFGDLQLVDASGTPTDAYPFYVFTEGTVEVVTSSSTGTATLLAGTYDVEVGTDPRLRETVTITAGEITELALPGIGTLELVDETGALVDDYTFLVYPADAEAQTIFSSDGTVDLLAGSYDVEVATNPPVREPITIIAGETTQIVLPAIGTIQLLDVDGNPTDAYAFYVYPEGTRTSIAYSFGGTLNLAAGTYDVEVYTNPTFTQTVTVTGGETTTIQLGGIGTLQIVNPDGTINDDYAFYVTEPGSTDIVVSGFGSTDIAVGTYDVEVSTSPSLTQTITVEAGETVDVVLGASGELQIVNADGTINSDIVFYVYSEGSTNIVASGFGTTIVAAGTYDVEIYSVPELVETVTIEGNDVVQITLPPTGIIQSVDGAGNPTSAEYYWVYPEGSDAYIAYVLNGSVEIAAGDYEVEFDSDSGSRYPVTVVEGETTEITIPE